MIMIETLEVDSWYDVMKIMFGSINKFNRWHKVLCDDNDDNYDDYNSDDNITIMMLGII